VWVGEEEVDEGQAGLFLYPEQGLIAPALGFYLEINKEHQ